MKKVEHHLNLTIQVDEDIPVSEVENLLTDCLMNALKQYDKSPIYDACDWELIHIRNMLTVGLEPPEEV